jgi:hypothetical protein
MSKVLVKMIHERRTGSYRKVDGVSGRVYPFRWAQEHRAYVAELDQAAVDDLFAMPRPSYLAPVVTMREAAPAPVNVTISPMEREARAMFGAILTGMGMPPPPEVSADVMQMMLGAYDKGRADAAAAAHLNAQPVDPLPSPAPVAEAPGTQETPPASPAPAEDVDSDVESEPEPDPEAGSDDGLTPKQRAARNRAARRKAERIAAGLESPPPSE